MKKMFLFLVFIQSNLFAQDAGDQIFDNEYLHEVKITSEDNDLLNTLYLEWQQFLFETIPYHPCLVEIDGIMVDTVGVRMKGKFSGFGTKKPLKIDFNRYDDDKNFDGLKKINLHTNDGDYAMQREAIAYDIMKTGGVKSSRHAYAKVYLNEDFIGIYSLVEQVDKTYLNHYFASNEGVLYKEIDGLIQVVDESGDTSYGEEMFNLAENPTGTFEADLEALLDTESFLRYMVILNLINSKDNAETMVNFYIYREPKSGLLTWIPWDFNFSLFPFANYSLDAITINDLFETMKTIPKYQERYYELACQMLEYNMNPDRVLPLIDSNANLIREMLTIDPYIDFTMSDFEQETQVIKDLIISRSEQITDELNSLEKDCLPLAGAFAENDIVINEFVASSTAPGGIQDPAGSYPDWLELYNNSDFEIPLEQFYLSDDKDFLKHWKFPKGTKINSHDYLIVWLDRDVNEEGLHADFKLKKDGGALILSFENGMIMDQVNYNLQESNVAMARIPNGTGDFVMQESTFGFDNENVGTNAVNIEDIGIEVFPNPCSDFINISFNKTDHQIQKVYIKDLTGKQLYQKNIIQDQLQIRLTEMQEGCYFLVFQTLENTIFHKIIVQH